MKKKRLLILLLVAVTVIEGCSVAPVQIVPEPASLKVGLGYCAPDTEPQEFLDPELSGRLGA